MISMRSTAPANWTNSLPADSPSSKTFGFTLIEIAIVCVIIGIIVGGIVVGNDLIKSAGARKVVAQYTQFETATKAFEEKYQTTPGDITTQEATQIGFAPTTRGSTDADTVKHGNGWIESGGGADLKHSGIVSLTSKTQFQLGINLGYESLLYWQDLATANLIDGSFRSLTSDDTSAVNITPANVDKFLPASKMGSGAHWSIIGSGVLRRNFYVLHAVSNTSAHAASLSPTEAFRLDSKIDDGRPASGAVMFSNPAGGAIIDVNVGGATTNCSSNDALNGMYDVAGHANDVVCNLVIETAF